MRLTNEDIKLRGNLLSKNPELLQLHRSLVMSGMITEDEFWSTRSHLLESHRVLMNQKPAPSTSRLLGMEIRTQTDIQGDTKIILTPALKESIFEQNPIVRKAFDEKIPSTVDEKTFWIHYFSSRFYKEGLNASSVVIGETKSPIGNILDEYYTLTEDRSSTIILDELISPSIDILATVEDHFQAADPSTRHPKEESERVATIRRLNKLSSDIVSSSNLTYLSSAEPELSELSHRKEEEYAELPANLPDIIINKKKETIVDEKHVDRMLTEWNNHTPFDVQHYIVNYSQYSEIMNRLPMEKNITEATFNPADLEVATSDQLKIWTDNTHELLRQFWSSYPPGNSKDKRDRVNRMASILTHMIEQLNGWLDKSSSLEERQYVEERTMTVSGAAVHAIELVKPTSMDSNTK